MASTNKSASAIADLQYIQSLLLKAKSFRNEVAKNDSLKNTTDKINGTVANVNSGPTAAICEQVTSDEATSSVANTTNDDPSSSTGNVTGTASRKNNMAKTKSSKSVELVDDGDGLSTSEAHYNYTSHVRNTAPCDRKAILDALREKKKIAQLQEIETSKTNIKINIKSVEPTPKTAQCEPSFVCVESKISKTEDKSEEKSLSNSVSVGAVCSVANGSPTDTSEPRPTAADFVDTTATNKESGSSSVENSMNLNTNRIREIGKIINEMKTNLSSNDEKLLPKSEMKRIDDNITLANLDDVSSAGSVCSEGAIPAVEDKLDDVSSIGSGEVEEGEITEDEEDTPSLSSPRVDGEWSRPDQISRGVVVDAVGHRLRVLAVGDSRARDMVAANGTLFTPTLCYIDDTSDILNFCSNINDKLKQDNRFDVVLIFVYHMNLIFADTVTVAGNYVELIQVRKNISISHLLKVVKVHDKKWSKLYPNTTFIWATPYPIDFIAYNETRLSSSRNWATTLMKAEQGSKANQNYWSYIKDISKNWNIVMSHVKRFPLHLPMLAGPTDRMNFRADGSGCLPSGYLINGVQPTERFRQQFATMFLQYLSETRPALGVRSFVDQVPFGAIATEVSAWLAESAAKPAHLFSNRGECFDAPELVQTTLRTHRELYTLYYDKPSQHPQYTRQRQIYSWQTSGVVDDEQDSGWWLHWNKFIVDDFDQTWAYKRKMFGMLAGDETRSSSSMREKDYSKSTGKKILISSDSDAEKRKKEPKHSRSRSKSKTSDRSRYRKSRHRSKKSTRDHHHHHHKKKKRRRKTISSSDATSDDEVHPGKRRHVVNEEEDDEDVDIDVLINKERANIAKKKEKKTAELKNNKETSDLSKPISISDSTLPLTDDIEISDGSIMSMCNSKENLSSSTKDVAACNGSARNESTDLVNAIIVSSESVSEAGNSGTDKNDKDELEDLEEIAGNHDDVPSSDEEIADFEMDLDIDEKMDELIDDPDFMKDLEKFGDDLESIIDKDQSSNDDGGHDDKENEEGIATAVSNNPLNNLASGASICEEHKNTLLNPKKVMERRGNYMVEVLRILNNVSNHFGPLAGSISNMHQKSLECLENAQDPIILLTKSNCAILEVVYSKLKRFIEEPSTPQVHRALYTIAGRELRQLLDNPQPDTDMFLGVNIANIAKATLGSDTTRVITFIKNTLMYHGVGEVPKDDVMRIFMAVKSVQLKLLENEEKEHQS